MKTELEIITIKFEFSKDNLDKYFYFLKNRNEATDNDKLLYKDTFNENLSYEGTFEENLLWVLKQQTTIEIIINSYEQIDFEKSKVNITINQKEGNPILYEFNLIELIDINQIYKLYYNKVETISELKKEIEELKLK